MNNIYNVNRSVAGHYVQFAKDGLNITKNLTNFLLPTKANNFSYYIDKIDAKADSGILKCIVSGWAYANKNSSPAKSIYLAHNNKIISRAKPSRRIDVRADKDLTFDHCGFECNFTLPNTTNMYHVATLIMVGDNNSQTHHFKIINTQHAKRNVAPTVALDRTVTRTDQPSFEYRIESALMQEGILKLKGWCFFREDPGTEVYINFLKSGVILGETTFQTQSRPDVADGFALMNDYHFFGFEYISYNLTELPLSPADRYIDMLLVTSKTNKKELIRIYSE